MSAESKTLPLPVSTGARRPARINAISRLADTAMRSPRAVTSLLAVLLVAMIWDGVANQIALDREQSTQNARRETPTWRARLPNTPCAP